jgi:hypothetical protein
VLVLARRNRTIQIAGTAALGVVLLALCLAVPTVGV